MLGRRGNVFRLSAGLLLGFFIFASLFLRYPSPHDTIEPQDYVATTPEDEPEPEPPAPTEPAVILPPLYPELAEAEEKLPQHNKKLPYPEGRHAKFLRFGNEMWGVGLNNQLQEILLNTYIARLAGRAYVFTPFLWDVFTSEPYVEIYDNTHLANPMKYRPAKVPLTAFIDSPTSGAPWPDGDRAPRSVSDAWFAHLCPEENRLYINTTVINPILGVDFDRDEGDVIVKKWAAYLASLDAQCVSIVWGAPRIIDFRLLGSKRMASIWPDYSNSPVITRFRWSPLVLSAVEKNLPPLVPPGHAMQSSNTDVSKIIPGLITLHVRRRDYMTHCSWMADWAEFEGWNQLPFLRDRYQPPLNSAKRELYMISRCWIEIDTIVARLRALRIEYPKAKLERVFVSTNADQEWTDQLKDTLRQEGWESIVATPDLTLSWEESGVDSAIDMEMASRGQIFIGNGFSSFSNTVVRLRLIRNVPVDLTRFW